MFIDIHCHLECYSDSEIEKVIDRARKENVKLILYNSADYKTIKKALELSSKYPEVKACLGIDPIESLKLSDCKLDIELEFIKKNKSKILAIGEVGLDLKEAINIEQQKKNLIKFICLAKELDIPIIIHSRKAEEEAINLLEEEKLDKVIMHCFSGNLKLVKRIIENKWFLSIPTNVTFSEHFQKVVEICPISQLFCETDSPFLHPFKGKLNQEKQEFSVPIIPDWPKGIAGNEPKNVVESYKKIAEIKNLSLEEVEKKIEDNFNKLFLLRLKDYC